MHSFHRLPLLAWYNTQKKNEEENKRNVIITTNDRAVHIHADWLYCLQESHKTDIIKYRHYFINTVIFVRHFENPWYDFCQKQKKDIHHSDFKRNEWREGNVSDKKDFEYWCISLCFSSGIIYK